MRKSILSLCLLVLAGLFLAISPLGRTQAHADMLATKLNVGLCVDLGSGRASLASCNGGASQNFFNTGSYGAQQFNGKCLQGTGSAQALFMAACNGSQDQMWLMENATGLYRNKGGWCANVSGGGASSGGQVISYACNSQANELWIRGSRAAPSPAQSAALARARPGDVIDMTGKIGGNIVAQGGGNIVAQGGGNIVAQGGGNAVSPH